MSEIARGSPPGRAVLPAAGARPSSDAAHLLSRRALLRTLLVGGGATVLAACQQVPAVNPRPAAGGAPAPTSARTALTLTPTRC